MSSARRDFERQLKLISKDDDTLFELEQYLQEQRVDLNTLAFYVKVIEFKHDSTNPNIVAGLILDNFLSDEAECYVGHLFSKGMVDRVIEKFQDAIEREK